jgi:hypothetical protein
MAFACASRSATSMSTSLPFHFSELCDEIHDLI